MLFLQEKLDPKELSPLALAYIGDAVYDLYVRSRLIEEGNAKVQSLHMRATSIVNATAQCNTVHAIMDHLTGEEITVYKRGRNAKSINAPKNSVVLEYRHATGLETLIGYLYVLGRAGRLKEILDLCYENADSKAAFPIEEEAE